MRMVAASIVFTVHNRKDALLRAVALAKSQTVPVEILVMDDASSDGVGEALTDLHPDVRYTRSDVARGPCYQRNRGIELATAGIVFALDDDSMLISSRTVEQTLADFEQDAATLVAIPFQNILQNTKVQHARAEPERREVVGAFTACAHAVRKVPFMAVGGYDPIYFYMGEEGDVAIRLLDAGNFVDLGSADPIHHMQPVTRRSYRADYYGRRNDILFYYLRCPATTMPGRIAGTILKGLIFGVRNRCIKATIDGLLAGLRLAIFGHVRRKPVRPQVFKAFMNMKHGRRYRVDELGKIIARQPSRPNSPAALS